MKNDSDTDNLVTILKWTAISLFGLIVLDKLISGITYLCSLL